MAGFIGQRGTIEFIEQPLYDLPSDLLVMDVTSDGRAFWFEQLPDKRIRVFIDGAGGESFDQLIPQRDGRPFVWSPDRRHIAFFLLRAARAYVGVDGREEGPYDDLSRSVPPTFSPDGSRLAYGAVTGGGTRLVLDGKILPDSQLAAGAVVFSPDGQHLAWSEQEHQFTKDMARRKTKPPPQRVVIDGVAGPWVEAIGDLPGAARFSPDSRRSIYAVREGKRQWFVLDGEAQPAFDGVDLPAFSPDSKRLAYAAGSKDRVLVVCDGDIGPLYYRCFEITFSPDGRHIAYVAVAAKDRMFVVLDGRPGQEFADVHTGLAFDGDSRRFAYLARRHRPGILGRFGFEYVPVIDGVVTEPFDDVSSNPHFSPAGQLAFAARRGDKWSMVLDGKPGNSYDRVGPPHYGPSGRLWYIAESAKRQTVVAGGREGTWATEVQEIDGRSVVIDAEDRHVAWVGKLPDGYHPVVDDRMGDAYPALGVPTFDTSHRVRFPATRDNRFLSLIAPLD